jgi:sterol desaturase/sphingolipid hydroxylase (fatty acid hydroxylase superfamily)
VADGQSHRPVQKRAAGDIHQLIADHHQIARALAVSKRKQGTRFKYNAKFPSDQPSDVFWFKSQNIDNFARSFFISIPLWTLVEVGMLYAFANGMVPWMNWSDNSSGWWC